MPWLGKQGSKDGEAALAATRQPFSAAWPVFAARSMPLYVRQTQEAFPGYDKLEGLCKSALVSLVYNRGASLTGESRSEMKTIHDLIAAGDPDSLNAVTSWSNFLANNGRAEEAFAPLDRYLAKHPDDRLARWWVGRTAAISGKQLDRGEQLLRVLLTEPQPTTGPRMLPENLHFRLGDIAAKRGDKATARTEYQAALKLNPRHEAAKKGLDAVK